MFNYKSIHYEEYYTMFEDGTSSPIDRKTCFAPAESVTADNPYKQRWFYSPDHKLAIRLPRNELGERLGKDNAADLKAQERYTENKHICIGQTSHATCSVTCETCQFRDYCDSEYRKENGIGCTRKCDFCNSYVGRTLELDKPIGEDDSGNELTMDIADESSDVEATYIVNDKNDLIQSVISALKPEDRELWKCLVYKVRKDEVAKRLGISVDGVTYRQNRLYRILLANPDLKNILKNF